jgi:two-component system, NarL family, nitrate/nitrite response regulator NarL
VTGAARHATTVLLVDDHPVVREGLRMFLSASLAYDVVAEADTAAAALAATGHHKPGIVLLDIYLGDESGLDLIPHLAAASPASRVIVVTAARDATVLDAALAAGARGLVQKDQAAQVLLKAIDKVLAGEFWFERAVLSRHLARVTGRVLGPSDPGDLAIASLTPREREIITLVGQGLKNQQIADALFVSEKTVRNHLTLVFSKLGVSDRFELALYAYRHGLARLPL